MIIVNRIDDTITGSLNGEPFGVSFDDTKYSLMKELEAKANSATSMEDLKAVIAEFEPLTKESYKELVETVCPYVHVNKHTNKFYLKTKDRISSKALPKPFVDRILTSVDKKIDVMPLVKAWTRFLRNPNYNDKKAQRFANYINKLYTNQELVAKLVNQGLSHEVATRRATTFQTPITQEGLLVTYKVSKEIDWKYELDEDGEPIKKPRYDAEIDDISGAITYKTPEHVEDRIFQPAVQGQGGDEFFCGDKKGHVIKVGKVHFLENWGQVNCNDEQSCVEGLHCGNLDYIRGYQHDDTITHNIFVDPMDIGALTDDGTGALRVRRYFVYASFAGVNRGIYHSSSYAAITDTEFQSMLNTAITETGELKEAADTELAEKQALI